MHCRIACILCCLATLATAQPPAGPVGRPERTDRQSAPAVDAEAVDRAIDRASQYLLGQIEDSGAVAGEYPATNPRHGGRTVLTIYALLRAGVDPADSNALAHAIDWAMQAKLWGTYAVGFRAAAMSKLKDDRAGQLMHRDAGWLLKAAGKGGAYTYTSAGGELNEDYDNSNGHIAAMGISAAAGRGVKIPLTYWKDVQTHWLAQQQPDGGWGYRLRPGESAPTAQTYGSMTAAGVATLYACVDRLGREHFVRCKPAPHGEAISRGLEWLEKNFSARLNPRKGVEWYYYWLFGLQRVGSLTGRKLIGQADWYAAGTDQLLKRQHTDGSWGFGERTDSTALALLFLSHGRAPTLLNKIRTAGRWNARPRDAANLVAWLGYTYERRLGWQVIGVDAPDADWDDARILYISGAGPLVLSDKQVDRLRQFVQRGGLILSEAAANNGDFTMDMHRIYQRMFPRYRLGRLSGRHPIYTLQFTDTQPGGLFAVHNGVRPLAIHAPQELSLALQLGPHARQRPSFNLMANLYLYLTEMGSVAPRGAATWTPPEVVEPKRTLRVARLAYDGNFDPEPLAFDRLALMLARDRKVKLEVSWPMDPRKLSASDWPVAHMTGTDSVTLNDEQVAALKRYLADDGMLIADAAGGSKDFAASFLALAGQIVDTGKLLKLPRSSPVYTTGPYDVSAVSYRRGAFEAAAETPRHDPRLQAVYVNDAPAIVFSLEDLSAGLVGYPLQGMAGYSPTSARHLMANLLWYAHRKTEPDASATAAPRAVDLDADADATVTEESE